MFTFKKSKSIAQWFFFFLIITNLFPNEAVSFAVCLPVAQKGSDQYNEINQTVEKMCHFPSYCQLLLLLSELQGLLDSSKDPFGSLTVKIKIWWLIVEQNINF